MPEQTIIVDTGPLVAFLVPSERNHAWVTSQFKLMSAPLLTCEPVLTEALFLLARTPNGVKQLWAMLDTGIMQIDFRVLDQRVMLAEMMEKYASLPMSLADACLVRMAELHDDSTVFSLDHHFRLYRKNRRQMIPALMPPKK